MKTPKQTKPGASGALLFADLILGHARRLENLATKRARPERFISAVEAGEAPHDCDLLGEAHAQRAAGKINDDALFFIVSWRGERSVEDTFEKDGELNRLTAKIRAIEKREGLDEFDNFIPGQEPADWKALDAKSNRRYEEVEKIQDAQFIRWLRHHGELDMANLFLNDRAAFDRRREAGRCFYFGPLPDINADTGEGDTGLTEVVTGDK
jgi:succinate dehydrogenase flavin-adding protein (antitoxin of CptAB toxin-antitoxin module)